MADTWANGSLALNGEQWFSFTATGTTQYIHAAFGTLTNLYVQLYGSTGAELGSQTNLTGSAASTFRTVTSGNVYYVRVTPYSSSYTGTYQITFNGGFGPPGTTILTVDTWANGSIALNGEQWFNFTATAATQYIHATLGTLPYLYVQLYDSTGVTVGSQTQLSDSITSTSRTVTSGNVYYVKVTPPSSSYTGTYQIAFNGGIAPPGTPILTADTWANGSLASGGKQWFSFTATAAAQYIHVTFGTLTDLDVQLYDGNSVAAGSQTTLSGSTRYVSRTVTSGNVYYVRVMPYAGSGTYQIGFNSDFWPPGTTPTTLTVDTWANGSLASDGEQWFSFTATAATQYIHATLGTLAELKVQLYDSTGVEVGSQVSLSTFSASNTLSINRPVTIGNVYYVKVWPYSSSYTGTYQIVFGGMMPPGTTPTTLTADTWANGSLASGGEQWFSFTATAATQYIHVTFGTLSSGSGVNVLLHDSNGVAVGGTNLTGSNKSTYQSITIGNVYYVRVRYNGAAGSYQIGFSSGIWTPGTPTLTAGVWANGSLASGGQQWFSFTATSATQYIHVTFGTLASSSGIGVTLYDSNGSAVGGYTRLYNSTLSISRTVTSGNVYYVTVGPYSNSYTGTYQIAFNTSSTSP
ncbi:hypothetical protein AGMMS49991_01930 [Spirochaetia bacterium]|nr:hypothetical protein AGMMS49991_01930 [Spirochaetia bacterium]